MQRIPNHGTILVKNMKLEKGKVKFWVEMHRNEHSLSLISAEAVLNQNHIYDL